MNKQIKRTFPKWCEDKDTKFELALSDDIDSLMCYVYQHEKFGREVKWFYDTGAYTDVQKIYKEVDYVKENSVLGLDMALEKGVRCWDNHVIKYSKNDSINPNSANLNNTIYNSCYYDKYIVSSFITMLSYYDEDLTTWSKDQLSVLCAVDGLYTPFLPKNSKYISTARKNLESLDYGYLADFMLENIEYIEQIKKDLNLNSKIKINIDGHFDTLIKLDKLSEIFACTIELPTKKFKKCKTLNRVAKPIQFAKDNIDKDIWNFSLVKKGYCCFSYAK